MSNEMIERVAKAMYKDYDWAVKNGFSDIMHGCAKKAIAAMREPTEGMVAAYRCDKPWRKLTSKEILALWIDAALKED